MPNDARIAGFVDDVDRRLTEAVRPVRHSMAVVLKKCGQQKKSAGLIAALDEALASLNIATRPGLLDPSLSAGTSVTFTREQRSSWTPGLTFPDEHSLEDFLVTHFREIPALSHLKRPRRQHRLPHGDKIDLLFEEKRTNALVVAELKVGKGGRDCVAQLFDYMSQVSQTPLAIGREVKGLIVTSVPNLTLQDHARTLAEEKGVEVAWFCYRIDLLMEEVYRVTAETTA